MAARECYELRLPNELSESKAAQPPLPARQGWDFRAHLLLSSGRMPGSVAPAAPAELPRLYDRPLSDRDL